MTSPNDSNKKNWLIQINDLTDKQIEKITKYVGNSSGAANPDLEIHHATLAMYLGYKKDSNYTENPKVTKNLKVVQFFLTVMFPYLLSFDSNLFPFLYFSGLALYSVQ